MGDDGDDSVEQALQDEEQGREGVTARYFQNGLSGFCDSQRLLITSAAS